MRLGSGHPSLIHRTNKVPKERQGKGDRGDDAHQVDQPNSVSFAPNPSRWCQPEYDGRKPKRDDDKAVPIRIRFSYSHMKAAIRLPNEAQPPSDFPRIARHTAVPDRIGRQAVGHVARPAHATAVDVAQYMKAAQDGLCDMAISTRPPESKRVANPVTA